MASITLFFLAASAAPTSLYAVYQARWGFSPITTTVVFGIYALSVLAALLTLGKLSDHVGRRPVLIAVENLVPRRTAVAGGTQRDLDTGGGQLRADPLQIGFAAAALRVPGIAPAQQQHGAQDGHKPSA